jgi:hypothetical protein
MLPEESAAALERMQAGKCTFSAGLTFEIVALVRDYC